MEKGQQAREDVSPDQDKVRPVVLLTGASSQLGVFLIPQLIESGFQVVAVSRKVAQPVETDASLLWTSPTIFSQTGDSTLESGLPRMMISCGPLELAAKAVSKWSQIRRLVVFSTTSVFTKADSGNQQEREQIAGILQQENILRVLCQKTTTELIILRPTLIYGCGLDQNISRLAQWIRRYGWLPVAGKARGLRQPVHAEDLAQLAVNALLFNDELNLDSPACGGSTLSYREMVERIFDSQSRRRRVVSLPAGLLSFGIEALSFMNLAGQANGEMITRQNIDLVFDDTGLRKLLEFKPRPFEPSSLDFEIQAEAARYQQI